MYSLNKIVVTVGTIVILISFLLALRMRKIDRTPDYLKIFYWCPLVALLASVNTMANKYFHLNMLTVTFIIQNSLILIELIFWGIFFSILLKNDTTTKYIKGILLVCVILIVLLYFSHNFNTAIFQTLAVSNLGKCILCIFYFNHLFKGKPKLNLKADPPFWIITGLFFYAAVTLPEYAAIDFLRTPNNTFLSRNIISVTNMAIIIMHLLFIKGCWSAMHFYKKQSVSN